MNKALGVFSCLLGLMALLVGMPAAAQPSASPAAEGQHRPAFSLFTFVEAPASGNKVNAAAPNKPTPDNGAAMSGEDNAGNISEDISLGPQETFGTRALSDLLNSFDTLRAQWRLFSADFVALEEASAWFERQNESPHAQAYWNTIGNDLVSVVGVSFLVAAVLELALFPARNIMRRRKPTNFFGRLAAGFGLLGLKMLSVLLFIGLSLGFMDQNQDNRTVRFVVLSVVYALALSRFVPMVSRFLFAPRTVALRLLPATGSQAIYIHRWICAFSGAIIFGYFCVDVAYAVHFPAAAITAFSNLLGFILVTMTIVVIVQKRALVSTRLRGNLPTGFRDLSFWQSIRLWFARRWHVLATIYLVVGYLITAFGVQNGFTVMLRGTILTLIILVLMRVLFHAVNRWGVTDAADGFHHAVLRFLFRSVIWVAAVIAAAAGWGVDIPALFATPFGQRVMGAGFSIGVTIITVTLVYEIFSAAIDRHLNRRDPAGQTVQASARARTLLPLFRNTAFIVFTIIVGLVVLSATGVNIGPLLAGAGVLGVAVGFGSQTLMKDFITGLFIVLENTIAVGDLVKVGEFYGVVETISIRTIRLRDENGALHILPFSEVSKISNMTRDISFAFMEIGVAYETNLEQAMDVIRAVGKDLKKDPVFGRLVLEPVDILGIEKLGDFSIIILTRVRTRPGMQREVRRMFLLRLKQRFDKEGIRIPFPTVTYVKPPLVT